MDRLARKQRRQRRRREDVIGAAIEVIERVGAKRFRMEEVAEAAGVSKPSLYYYFKDKDDVVRAIAAQVATEFAEKTASELRGRVGPECAERFLRLTVSYYADRLELFRVVFAWSQVQTLATEESVGGVNAAMNELFAAVEAALDGQIPAQLHPRRVAVSVWSTAFGLLSMLSLLEASGSSSSHATEDLVDESCAMLRRALV